MTSTEDLPPTMGERYSSAIESSNLRLGEKRGDVDLVIAAGLVPDGLGSTMLRLQVEYDGVRAAHALAEKKMRQSETYARRQTGVGSEGRSEAIMKVAEAAARTEHVLILSQLTTLREAKQAFGDFAVVQATKRKFMRPDREAIILAGQVLDVWLRPICGHCQGRGFNGDLFKGEPQVPCKPCKASGQRREEIGRDDQQRIFVGHLLMETDAMIAAAQGALHNGLRMVREAKERIAEAGS